MVEPTTKPLTVYRGVKKRKYVLEDLVDGVGFEPSYLSTSVEIEPAIRAYTSQDAVYTTKWEKEFTIHATPLPSEDQWCCLIQYTVMPGTKGIYISDSITEYSEEKELLLQRGGTVVLTGFQKRNLAKGIIIDTFYMTFYPPEN